MKGRIHESLDIQASDFIRLECEVCSGIEKNRLTDWPKPDQKIKQSLSMLEEMTEIFFLLEEEKISVTDVLKVVKDERSRRHLANQIVRLSCAIDMS